jgi:3-hydroxymyristoyl/3-hydroxydecanoyl-(acyl carrier protein) dehydratase
MNDILQAPAAVAENVTPPLVQARASLAVSGNDIFALGHYPDNPIYPGVLIAEQLCQLAMLGARALGPSASVRAIKRIQYLDAVLPGDVVELTATAKKRVGDELEVTATAQVGDRVKTRATLVCVAHGRVAVQVPASQLSLPGERALPQRSIAAILPHRYPFLLLDTVEDHVPGQWLRGRKVVTRASPLFLEGLPAHYPQGLVIESIGQAGIALFFLSRESATPVDIVLGSVADTDLLCDVPFNAALTIDVRIDRLLPNGVVFSGQACVGEQVVTRVGSLIAMIDPRHQPPTGLTP